MRIDLGTYRKLLAQLRQEYKLVNSKLVIHYRPQTRRHGKGDIHGIYTSYDDKPKGIVTVRPGCPREKILFAAAHELKHAIDHHLDLFPGFYDRPTRVGAATAFKIEQDCDQFATDWLRSFGIEAGQYRFYTNFEWYKDFYKYITGISRLHDLEDVID